MKAIILAGGKEEHMKGQRVPKSLVKVGSFSLIDRIVRQLFQAGVVDHVIFSLGHRSTEVRKHLEKYPRHLRDRFQYINERKKLGTGGAIRRALQSVEDIDEPIVIINGDVVSDLNPRALLVQHRVLERDDLHATLAAVEVQDSSESGHLKYNPNTWSIRSFNEKTGEKRPGAINAGWYVFTKRAFEHHAPEKKDVFSLENDVFPHMASAGRLRLYLHKGRWSNINTQETLKRVRSEYT